MPPYDSLWSNTTIQLMLTRAIWDQCALFFFVSQFFQHSAAYFEFFSSNSTPIGLLYVSRILCWGCCKRPREYTQHKECSFQINFCYFLFFNMAFCLLTQLLLLLLLCSPCFFLHLCLMLFVLFICFFFQFAVLMALQWTASDYIPHYDCKIFTLCSPNTTYYYYYYYNVLLVCAVVLFYDFALFCCFALLAVFLTRYCEAMKITLGLSFYPTTSPFLCIPVQTKRY